MTRTEIIAQLDAELSRLESARDFLTAALKDSNNNLFKASFISKVTPRLPAKPRKRPVPSAAPAGTSLPVEAVAAVPPATQAGPAMEPKVSRIPPRRRMGRRQLASDRKSPAALSGLVPAGPVAVSAVEARKMHDRVAPAPPANQVAELRPEGSSERTLGSLIQAFERRSGLSGVEIP